MFEYEFIPGDDRTLLMLHGTGGNQHDLVEFGKSLLPGATLISPAGRIQERGMRRWFRRYSEGVFDSDSIQAEASALAKFLREIYQAHSVNPERVVAVGYSNGANMAGSLLLLQPEVLGGIVMLRGMFPIEPETASNLNAKSALLINGLQDPMGPVESASQMAEYLKVYGVAVQQEILETGHNLSNRDFVLSQQWLSQHLKVEKT
jgi:phospholipase/carboxylesterase